MLPRRTAHVRRTGRHRSPHRLSIASGAPDLILAVPGEPADAAMDIAAQIAVTAQGSCPGVDIGIGFISGEQESLASLLAQAHPDYDEHPPDHQDTGEADGIAGPGLREAPEPAHAFDSDQHFDPAAAAALDAVIVPLLAGPHPEIDPVLEAAVAAAVRAVMLAPPLGPHPVLAEALHDRLAEAGLARAGRARGLNFTTGASGVLLLAARGPEAASAAGVTAVLLAARLAVPVVPASLGDPAGIAAAFTRLRESGLSQIAISPAIIGPECDPAELAEAARSVGVPCAAPLGAHPAIAQLVAIRYGEALAKISVSSH